MRINVRRKSTVRNIGWVIERIGNGNRILFGLEEAGTSHVINAKTMSRIDETAIFDSLLVIVIIYQKIVATLEIKSLIETGNISVWVTILQKILVIRAL